MHIIADRLLEHYRKNARDLPWRVGPNSVKGKAINPYHVWLSEIMLQQTTVAAVIPYFEKFTKKWPNFLALAKAKDEEVMAAWAGLGYYARARNLVKCARLISTQYDGQLPQGEIELKKLPGIGNYTAAAISSIAFGQYALVIDANIERVISRLYEIPTPLPKGKKDISKALEQIVPQELAGDFAQSLMDLGASYCSVKNPKCDQCPLYEFCGAAKANASESYPVKAPKKDKPVRYGMAWWIVHDENILLVKRPSKGMLGGMMALPDDGWNARHDGDERLSFVMNPQDIVKKSHLNEHVQHSFTHFSLKLKLISIELNQRLDENVFVKDAAVMDAIWWPIADIDTAGLPTTFDKAVKVFLRG